MREMCRYDILVTGETIKGGPRDCGAFKLGESMVRFLVLPVRKLGNLDEMMDDVTEVEDSKMKY